MALGTTIYNELGLATWGLNETPYADISDTGNTTGKSVNNNWDLIDKRFKYLRDAIDFDLLVVKPTDYLVTYGMWAYNDSGAGEKVLKLEGFERIDVVATNDIVAFQSWVEQYFQGIDWQDSVLDKDLVTAPAPVLGARYIIAGTGGAWSAGTINDITQCTVVSPETWVFTTPNVGMTTEVEDESIWYRWNGSAWSDISSVVSHNNTSGKQGGTAGEFYHLTVTQHTDVASISPTQWGYLGALDQDLDTIADVTFNSIAGDGSALTGIGAGASTALSISCKIDEVGGITEGQWVYLKGVSGITPTVALGDNTNTIKEHFFGIARTTGADTDIILITTSGEIDGLNTNGYSASGVNLYCSTTGNFVETAPTSGSVIHAGHVIVKSPTVGRISAGLTDSHVLGGVASQDTVLRMGDNAGANYVLFKDYANNTVASINSDGNVIFNQINLATSKYLYFGDSNETTMRYTNSGLYVVASGSNGFLVADKAAAENMGFHMKWGGSYAGSSISIYMQMFGEAWINETIMQGDRTVYNFQGGDVDFELRGEGDNNLLVSCAEFDKVTIGIDADTITANYSKFNVEGDIMSKEIATPGAQISGYGKWYFKADHKPYAQGDDGAEYSLTMGGGFTTQTLTDAANIDWDMSSGNFAVVTLAGNRNFNAPTNLVNGGHYFLTIKQDGTGTRLATFNAVFKFPAGIAPTLSTGINEVDILEGVSDGTNIYCVLNKDFS